MIDRKSFLKIGGLGITGLLINPAFASAQAGTDKASQSIKFGVITDLHYDLMHDSEKRAAAFIAAMKQEKPDFIIQLGDFCMPKPQNKPLMDIWNSFKGDKYHVLGNLIPTEDIPKNRP